MSGAASAATLVLSIGILCARRIETVLQLCAAQALCAAVALATPVAGPAVLLNGVVLPLAMLRLNRAPDAAPRHHFTAFWLLALLVLVTALAVVVKLGSNGAAAAGVAAVLLGLCFSVFRSHALAPAISLLAAQNGLLLVASAHPHLSLSLALASAVPLLPSLLLAESRLRR